MPTQNMMQPNSLTSDVSGCISGWKWPRTTTTTTTTTNTTTSKQQQHNQQHQKQQQLTGSNKQMCLMLSGVLVAICSALIVKSTTVAAATSLASAVSPTATIPQSSPSSSSSSAASSSSLSSLSDQSTSSRSDTGDSNTIVKNASDSMILPSSILDINGNYQQNDVPQSGTARYASIYSPYNSFMGNEGGVMRRQLTNNNNDNNRLNELIYQQQQQQDGLRLLDRLTRYLPLMRQQKRHRSSMLDSNNINSNNNNDDNLEQEQDTNAQDLQATIIASAETPSRYHTNNRLNLDRQHTNSEQLAALLGQEQTSFSDAIDALVLAAASQANQQQQSETANNSNDLENAIMLPPEMAPIIQMNNNNNNRFNGRHSMGSSNKRAPSAYALELAKGPNQLMRFGDQPTAATSPVGKRPAGHRYDFGLGKRAGVSI